VLADDDERARLAEELGPIAAPAESAEASSDSVVETSEALDVGSESSHLETEPEAQKKPLTTIDRLKQRMPFRVATDKRNDSRRKAQEIYKAALVSLRRGNEADAIANLRLALAFDEENATYRATLDEIQNPRDPLSHLSENVDSMSRSELLSALRVCEQSVENRPDDPEALFQAGSISVGLGNYDRAQDFAERAIQLKWDEGRFYAVLGRALEGQSEWTKSIDAFEEVLRLAPEDEDSKRRLAGIKWRMRATRGEQK
jgi:tetratricopeptide (TPR) repeat protein